jgi:hypothetical protein
MLLRLDWSILGFCDWKRFLNFVEVGSIYRVKDLSWRSDGVVFCLPIRLYHHVQEEGDWTVVFYGFENQVWRPTGSALQSDIQFGASCICNWGYQGCSTNSLDLLPSTSLLDSLLLCQFMWLLFIMIHIVHQAVCYSVIHSRVTAASVVPAPRNLFGDLVGWSFVSFSPTLFVMCIIW